MPGTPVVFVHGLWLHAESWGAWIARFNEAGYQASAPGWPGDAETVAETRASPDSVAGHGIDDVVDHYAGIIGSLETKPIVIGHSFGGLIAQRLLGNGLAAAAVGIDPAPIKGGPLPAAVGTPRRICRAPQPREQEARRLAHGRPVPVRLRQRGVGRGVEGALGPVDDPLAGRTAVRGRGRGLRAALAGDGRHAQLD